jgi:hypothetical protein
VAFFIEAESAKLAWAGAAKIKNKAPQGAYALNHTPILGIAGGNPSSSAKHKPPERWLFYWSESA